MKANDSKLEGMPKLVKTEYNISDGESNDDKRVDLLGSALDALYPGFEPVDESPKSSTHFDLDSNAFESSVFLDLVAEDGVCLQPTLSTLLHVERGVRESNQTRGGWLDGHTVPVAWGIVWTLTSHDIRSMLIDSLKCSGSDAVTSDRAVMVCPSYEPGNARRVVVTICFSKPDPLLNVVFLVEVPQHVGVMDQS